MVNTKFGDSLIHIGPNRHNNSGRDEILRQLGLTEVVTIAEGVGDSLDTLLEIETVLNGNSFIKSNGTVPMSGDLDMGTNNINNVGNILIDHPNEIRFNNSDNVNRKIIMHEVADNLNQYTGFTTLWDGTNTHLRAQVESPDSSFAFMFGQDDTGSASRFTISNDKVYSNVELSAIDKISVTNANSDECSIRVVTDAHMKFYRGENIKMSLSSIQNVMYQEINMNSNKISSVGEPVYDTDAATKSYSDTKLPLSGGTISDVVSIEKNVTGDFIALTLKNLSQSYSATKVVLRMEENRPAASFVQLELNDGGNFACNVNGNYMWYSGASLTKFYTYIDLNSQKIQSLADPTIGTDGANKQYVDYPKTSTGPRIDNTDTSYTYSSSQGVDLMNNIVIIDTLTANRIHTLPNPTVWDDTGFPNVASLQYTDFTYINNNATYKITLASYVGSDYGDMDIAPQTSGRFRAQWTSTSAYNIYRLS
jgi:hypothetical protein